MASAKVDRLIRATTSLEAALRHNELMPVHGRKSLTFEKERAACLEIREILVYNDFASIYKEDKRYSDQYTKAVEALFKLVNHSDTSLRTLSEESIDASLRKLLLTFNHSRIIVILITEINKNGPARSLVAAFNRLVMTIHLSKANRIMSYGVHIVNALSVMLKRPEDIVQNALLQGIRSLFSVLGPRLRDQHVEKAFELYRVAADNLELAGTANRAAVIVISQISTYYSSILKKALSRCLVNIRRPDENEGKHRLVGSLNVIKGIWELTMYNQDELPPDNLKNVIVGVLLCLHSKHSEVVLASLEVLERIMFNPLLDMSFHPPSLPNKFTPPDRTAPEMTPSARSSLSGSPLPGSSHTSALSSPLGSLLELNACKTISEFAQPLDLPERPSSSGESTEQEDIIDPLLHAELFEEQKQEAIARRAESTEPPPNHTPSPVKQALGIPDFLPDDFCSPLVDCFTYSALLVGKRFLLASLKGLKNDREVRISHKMLALNCLSTIALKHPSIGRAVILWKDCEQPLSDVARFVLHEDDQLCAAALGFIANCDRKSLKLPKSVFTGMYPYCFKRVVCAFQPIRKRALLQSVIGDTELLLHYNLFSEACRLAVSSTDSTFFLLRTTVAEWISSIEWRKVDHILTLKWQRQCLAAFTRLLFCNNPKVENAVVEFLPRFISNTELGCLSNIFHQSMPENIVGGVFETVPVVLGMPPTYSFRNEAIDFTIEENLEIVLIELFREAAKDGDSKISGLVSSLNQLVLSFPPASYRDCWQSATRTVGGEGGLLSQIIDIAELESNSPQMLVRLLNIISALFAGQMEGQMMRALDEQIVSDRKSLPRHPNPVLTERLLLLPLRVMNLYYSLLAEHKSSMSQSSIGILSRPNISTLHTGTAKNATASASRIADISRLLGTNIHPSKQSSFLECPSLMNVFPQIRGAYRNFLEKVGPDFEKRLTELLNASLECLRCMLEMLTYPIVRPLLEEILLYIKVVFEIDPQGCTLLLHQLFKLVFGKNAAGINLDTLQQLNMKHPMSPSNLMDMYLVRSINEFTLFTAFVNRSEFVDVYMKRHVGWLRADVLSKVHVPENSEITSSIQIFEGFVTNLIHVYQSFNSVSIKKAILGVMCELPRDGVVYTLADPKRGLFDSVLSQIEDMQSNHVVMLRQVFLYFIVLARAEFIDWERVERLITDVIEKTTERNCEYALAALDVVVCEALVVNKHDETTLWNLWKGKARQLAKWCPEATMNIWTVFLHSARKNELMWLEWSLEFWSCYDDFLIESKCQTDSLMYTLIVAVSCLAPQTFHPIDAFFKTLTVLFIEKECGIKERISHAIPSIFLLLTGLSEDRALVRLEKLVDNPIEWLARQLFNLLWQATLSVQNIEDSTDDVIVLLLQIFSYALRTERLPKLCAAIRFHCSVSEHELFSLNISHPRLLVHWLSLLALTPAAVPTFKFVLEGKCSLHIKHVTIMLFVDLLKEESLSSTDLNSLFGTDSDVNLALTILTISEKKVRNMFVELLPQDALEAFISTAAKGATENIEVKAAFDVLSISEIFFEKYGIVPCPTVLSELIIEIEDLLPEMQEKCGQVANRMNLAAACQIIAAKKKHDGIPILEMVSNCQDAISFFRCSLQRVNACPTSVILKNIVSMPTQNLYYIFENVPLSQQMQFMTICLTAAEQHVLIKSVEPEEQKAAAIRGQEILDTVYDFIANSPPLAMHVYAKLGPILVRTNLCWPDSKSGDNAPLLQYLTSLVEATPFELLGIVLDGCSFYFSSPSVVEGFRMEPFADLTILQIFVFSLAVAHEKVCNVPFERNESPNFEIVGLNSECQMYKEIVILFDSVQYLLEVYRSNSLHKVSLQDDILEQSLRVILRHPLLHAMATVPVTALRMNWKPRMEIRGESSLIVPLVNIHLLCNVDILADFTWRVRWLGWTNRKQFEDFWMSLFGVLSSTPTGTELTQQNSAQHTEQILASSWAVGALTDILLQALLFPEPGNTATSKFIVKHREKTEMVYKSKSMMQLSAVKARLINDLEPATVYRRNMERLIDCTGKKYGPGQLSALSLWTLTGVLGDENPESQAMANSPKIRVSLSEYLIKMSCELDTASSVRALFENYSHWFSRGLEYISLPLLSATVRSMTLLSDLFDESSSYIFLFSQMKNVFNGRMLHSHPDLGYVIFSLLKAVTVVGIESVDSSMSEVDLCKQLQIWIETGLTSIFTEVRETTLHGFLYLLQSMAGELLQPITQYVASFLLAEVTKQLAITDPIQLNNTPSSTTYETLVWSSAFRVMEEPVQGSFKTLLNQKLCEALLVVNLPVWVLEYVTSGIESLVFHSSTFAEQFTEVVKESFRDYQFHTGKFPFALRIFLACVFREEADPTRNSYKKFQSLTDEVLNLLKRCDASDASLMAIALPPLLCRLYRDSKVVDMILDVLIPPQKLQLPDNSRAMFEMIFEIFERLRDKQRLSSSLQLCALIVRRVYASSLADAQKKMAAILLLTAASTENDVVCRFHVLLDQCGRDADSWDNCFEWILSQSAESFSDGGQNESSEKCPMNLESLLSLLPQD